MRRERGRGRVGERESEREREREREMERERRRGRDKIIVARGERLNHPVKLSPPPPQVCIRARKLVCCC